MCAPFAADHDPVEARKLFTFEVLEQSYRDCRRRKRGTTNALRRHLSTIVSRSFGTRAFVFRGFLSRCVKIPLAQRDLAKAFAERARKIATEEALNGKPIGDYVKLVNKHGANFRAVLMDIESGGMA